MHTVDVWDDGVSEDEHVLCSGPKGALAVFGFSLRKPGCCSVSGDAKAHHLSQHRDEAHCDPQPCSPTKSPRLHKERSLPCRWSPSRPTTHCVSFSLRCCFLRLRGWQIFFEKRPVDENTFHRCSKKETHDLRLQRAHHNHWVALSLPYRPPSPFLLLLPPTHAHTHHHHHHHTTPHHTTPLHETPRHATPPHSSRTHQHALYVHAHVSHTLQHAMRSCVVSDVMSALWAPTPPPFSSSSVRQSVTHVAQFAEHFLFSVWVCGPCV